MNIFLYNLVQKISEDIVSFLSIKYHFNKEIE